MSSAGCCPAMIVIITSRWLLVNSMMRIYKHDYHPSRVNTVSTDYACTLCPIKKSVSRKGLLADFIVLWPIRKWKIKFASIFIPWQKEKQYSETKKHISASLLLCFHSEAHSLLTASYGSCAPLLLWTLAEMHVPFARFLKKKIKKKKRTKLMHLFFLFLKQTIKKLRMMQFFFSFHWRKQNRVLDSVSWLLAADTVKQLLLCWI